MATESLERIKSISKSSDERTKDGRKSSMGMVMITGALMVVI